MNFGEFQNEIEIEILKKQAQEIHQRIKELQEPPNLASITNNKPYRLPDFENKNPEGNVTFLANGAYDYDAWKHFLELGKIVHSKNGVFKERTECCRRRFVDEVGRTRPRMLRELTNEEIRISAMMIDEMVEVYNRYMVVTHPTVTLYDKHGIKHIIPTV